jgi:hypothetical protein
VTVTADGVLLGRGVSGDGTAVCGATVVETGTIGANVFGVAVDGDTVCGAVVVDAEGTPVVGVNVEGGVVVEDAIGDDVGNSVGAVVVGDEVVGGPVGEVVGDEVVGEPVGDVDTAVVAPVEVTGVDDVFGPARLTPKTSSPQIVGFSAAPRCIVIVSGSPRSTVTSISTTTACL